MSPSWHRTQLSVRRRGEESEKLGDSCDAGDTRTLDSHHSQLLHLKLTSQAVTQLWRVDSLYVVQWQNNFQSLLTENKFICKVSRYIIPRPLDDKSVSLSDGECQIQSR